MRYMEGFTADAKVVYEDASQVAADAVGSIHTVSSFCTEEKLLKLYNEKCRSTLQKGIRQGIISGVIFGFSKFIVFATHAFCFWFGAKLVVDGKTTIKEVLRVFFAITMSAMSVSQSTGIIPDLTNVKAAVNSVFALLDRQSESDSADGSGLVPESVIGDIEFKCVSFRYPTRPDIQVLKDLSLFVKAGKTVALVGESGCGKSTTIVLLERLYDPDNECYYRDREAC